MVILLNTTKYTVTEVVIDYNVMFKPVGSNHVHTGVVDHTTDRGIWPHWHVACFLAPMSGEPLLLLSLVVADPGTLARCQHVELV